jgi:hypothetical protein
MKSLTLPEDYSLCNKVYKLRVLKVKKRAIENQVKVMIGFQRV